MPRVEVTRQALQSVRPHPYDWLILAGDVGETEEHLRFALSILTRRFAQLLWVPGNHDLWTLPTEPAGLCHPVTGRQLVGTLPSLVGQDLVIGRGPQDRAAPQPQADDLLLALVEPRNHTSDVQRAVLLS